MRAERVLREGVTTGSCAAAAAAAAAFFIRDGRIVDSVTGGAPARKLSVDVAWVRACPGGAEAGVVKDGGDDPDVTSGLTVQSRVRPRTDGQVTFCAGAGVGTVTGPGLKVQPGQPAINPVPRQMIAQAVLEVLPRGADVTVSIPGGETVAGCTYNPRLGIVGGLSVLGTSGIVRPMSEEALKATFKADLDVKAAKGRRRFVFVFGNMGEEMTQKLLKLGPSSTVQMGNEVGFMLREARRLEVTGLILAGHSGKMIKLSAGIFQTHSRVADGRMETLCALAALEGAPLPVLNDIYAATTTEAVREILCRAGLESVWGRAALAAQKKAAAYLWGDVRIETAFLDNDGQLLGASAGLEELASEIREDEAVWENSLS